MKKRGRPRKNGAKDPWSLARALMVIHAYDEARTGGIKHSAAVKEAADFVRWLCPGMPISETEVKRILAELRPAKGPAALLSSYEILEGEEAARARSRFAQMLALAGQIPPDPPNQDPSRPLKRFSVSLGKRPNYPRYNAKNSGS